MAEKNITQLKNNIMEYLKIKDLVLYKGIIEEFEDDKYSFKYCEWNDYNDWKSFFEITQKLDVKIIYFKEEYTESGEIGTLNFQFIYNKILHTLYIISDKQQEENLKMLSSSELEDSFELDSENDNLCKRCKKEPKAYNDKDFCFKCIEELKEIATKEMEKLKEELKKDKIFINLTSEQKAIAYVIEKFKDKKKENKFIYLPKLAKETYSLLKLNK